MTGEVAFSEVTFMESLAFWNSTQFSTHKPQERKKERVHQSTSCMAKENKTKIRCLEGPGLESCEPHIVSRATDLLPHHSHTPTVHFLPFVYRFSLRCGPTGLKKRLLCQVLPNVHYPLGNCPRRRSPNLGGTV